MKRAAAREGLPEGRQTDTGGEWRGMKRRKSTRIEGEREIYIYGPLPRICVYIRVRERKKKRKKGGKSER